MSLSSRSLREALEGRISHPIVLSLAPLMLQLKRSLSKSFLVEKVTFPVTYGSKHLPGILIFQLLNSITEGLVLEAALARWLVLIPRPAFQQF